jgi:DNA-binding NarL/FixJ family response regulator
VGEVSRLLEAIQKAVELKPDLIVLDIGLPTLNGIEAARQILKLVPEYKIIFLSQESPADVVQEAFSLGALDYVVKAKAARSACCCGFSHLWEESVLIAHRRVTISTRRIVLDGMRPSTILHYGAEAPFAPALLASNCEKQQSKQTKSFGNTAFQLLPPSTQ